MKRFLALVFISVLFVGTAYAEPQLNRQNIWRAENTFKKGVVVQDYLTEPTGGVTAGEIADVVRYMNLPLASFITNGVPVTNATAPGIEVDDLVPGIVWADGEVTPALISFRVPSDYSSGGAFKVFATESNSTTPNQVDFLVYVNSDGADADAAASDQTPVAIDGVTSTGTEITLTPGTDFATLAAGNWVTLGIWRDNVATGSGDLEVKGVSFYYTATQ